LEEQSERGLIDLFYGDTGRVSEEGYVPYAWQFKDEKVGIPSTHGNWMNCFGLLNRDNKLHFKTSRTMIDSAFMVDFLDDFSLKIQKNTVIVLDNASVHNSKIIMERLGYWQNRGLYIFYLPKYSPQLNIIERLWRELKGKWLRPLDYLTADTLFLATTLALSAVGSDLKINFGPFLYGT
jgi:transposase